MTTLFQALLTAIATCTHKKLARQIQFLKVENEILRGKLPRRITVTPAERRRLIRAAKGLGSILRHLTSIVHPDTILKWIRHDRKGYVPKLRGRKRKPINVRRLVLKLARENNWGYTRILGEMKKLGIGSVSKNTVKRILKEGGYDPGPKRGARSWDAFLKCQAVSLWQCDFLAKRIVTLSGIRYAFVLVFLHVKTRQVILTPSTLHPTDAWVVEQTERFLATARYRGLKVRHIQHDSDGKFRNGFRAVLKRHRLRRTRNQYRSPNLNAFVERFMLSIQEECLDEFLVMGTQHLDHLVGEFVTHYHEERPHQGLDNERILAPSQTVNAVDAIPLNTIRCQQRLGGLLKSYRRAA